MNSDKIKKLWDLNKNVMFGGNFRVRVKIQKCFLTICFLYYNVFRFMGKFRVIENNPITMILFQVVTENVFIVL